MHLLDGQFVRIPHGSVQRRRPWEDAPHFTFDETYRSYLGIFLICCHKIPLFLSEQLINSRAIFKCIELYCCGFQILDKICLQLHFKYSKNIFSSIANTNYDVEINGIVRGIYALPSYQPFKLLRFKYYNLWCESLTRFCCYLC